MDLNSSFVTNAFRGAGLGEPGGDFLEELTVVLFLRFRAF